MTNKQIRTRRAVREIWQVLNAGADKKHLKKKFTQEKFANLVGASTVLVKKWMQKNPVELSTNFDCRIMFQLGAFIQPDGSVLGFDGKKFTQSSFRHWRENFMNDDEAKAIELGQKMGEIVRRLILAAVPKPGQSSRMSLIIASFNEWVQKTVDDFKLRNRFNEVFDREHKKPAKPTRR